MLRCRRSGTIIVLLMLPLVVELGCSGSGRSAGASSAASPPAGKEKRAALEPQAGEVEYEGRRIAFDERTEPPELTIDDVRIPVGVRTRPNGEKRYSISVFTYRDFSTLPDLAKALIHSRLLDPSPGKSSD